MKRILTLLLALSLMLSLAACTPARKPTETEASKTGAPETEAPETEAPETENAGSAEIRGTVQNGVYENRLLNLRIACPEGWIIYDDQQIAQVNNITADVMKDSDVGELIGKNGQFMDLMAVSGTGGSINLIIQPKQALLDAYSDLQVFALSKETFKAQFKASGFEITEYEPVTMQVGGEERTVLHIIMSGNGVDMDEYQIWYRNNDTYMGVLTLAITDGSDPQPILEGISSLQ